MHALLAELSVNILRVVFVVEDLLLHLVESGLYEGVAACPFAHSVFLLVNNLALIVEPAKLLRVPVFCHVKLSRHNVHEGFAFVVLLLNNPIPLLRAIVWELHQRI